MRVSGGSQEVPRRVPGRSRKFRRAPRTFPAESQEVPRRFAGGSQEGRRRFPPSIVSFLQLVVTSVLCSATVL